MRTRLSVSGLLGWMVALALGCTLAPAVSSLIATATPPPTQVPLPTAVAAAVATPTLSNLVPPGDTAEAAVMLNGFIQAVSKGDVSGAMTYWDTSQPGEPSGYDANVRKIVQGWVDHKSQLVLGNITYSGPDATGKNVPMPWTNPLVNAATARVKIDGVDYVFYLTSLKGGWFIEGINTVSK